MEYKDYYQALGVSRDAGQDEIKRAYRKLARKYHPDVSKEPDAETRFKEVGEAYEVLKDPEKRAAYDQLGANWKSGQDFRPPPGWERQFDFGGGGFTDSDASAFSDFFENLFGHARGGGGAYAGRHWRHQHQARGEDHQAKVAIDVEDAFHGAVRQISLSLPEADAQGRVRQRQRTLNVKIPKGIKAGQRIRLSNQGGSGLGDGKAGDLYLEVEFKPHTLYKVEGRDLYLDVPVAPWEAALGDSVKIPTPGGWVQLKIPAGSQSGRQLRLKGRGLPGSPPGDLFAVLQIATPPAHTAKEKQFYQSMREEFAFNPRTRMGAKA